MLKMTKKYSSVLEKVNDDFLKKSEFKKKLIVRKNKIYYQKKNLCIKKMKMGVSQNVHFLRKWKIEQKSIFAKKSCSVFEKKIKIKLSKSKTMINL
jgi:hypothetical protein